MVGDNAWSISLHAWLLLLCVTLADLVLLLWLVLMLDPYRYTVVMSYFADLVLLLWLMLTLDPYRDIVLFQGSSVIPMFDTSAWSMLGYMVVVCYFRGLVLLL